MTTTDRYVPHCLRDAPPEILDMCRMLAATARETITQTLAEHYTNYFDPSDPNWQDLIKGVFLMAAHEEKR